MTNRFRAAWLLLLSFTTALGALEPAAKEYLQQGALPATIEPLTLDLAAESRRKAEKPSSTGLEFLLFDRQIDVERNTATSHVVYRIVSEAGLAGGARLDFEFDPSYERLTFHAIRTWRNGTPRDRLDLGEIKLLQQERELDRQVYNGSFSTLQMLPDVRVGDLVEYVITTTGRNPVFGGKLIETMNFGWASDVRRQRLRVLLPAGRQLYTRMHGDVAVEHDTRARREGGIELIWEARDLAPISPDDEVPSWHRQYPFLELSEFRDWSDVVAWAAPLYEVAAKDSALAETARTIVAGRSGREEQILAILDFVQREVRYLAVALGPNSHQPHPPGQVLERRFGDCKDKTTLFCALLREIGINAHPVLVHTYQRHTTRERLPGPYAFNHVIARVRVNNRDYWLDPTQNYQRGALAARDNAEETAGLVIDDGVAALTKIPARPETRSKKHLTETFQSFGVDQPAKLKLTYVYSGDLANSMRHYFATSQLTEITRSYLDLHKRSYPALTLESGPSWRDDERNNIIRVELAYLVPDFWEKDGDVISCSLYPWLLRDYVVQPDRLTRNAPLSLAHPYDLIVDTIVHLGEDWKITDETNVVESPWYRFDHDIKLRNQTLSLQYRWSSRADHVEAADLKQHLAKLAEIRTHVGYSLTHNLALTRQLETASLNWRTITLTVVVLGSMAWFGVWLWRRPRATSGESAEPPVLTPRSSLAGINGWLILPAIGLCLRPLLLISAIVEAAESYFHERVWLAYMLPGVTTYDPNVILVIVTELTVNLLLLGLTLITLVFFFARRREAPGLMIALLAAWPLLMGGYHLLLTSVPLSIDLGSDDTLKAVIQVTVAAVVWIPYFRTSRRVRETFTR